MRSLSAHSKRTPQESTRTFITPDIAVHAIGQAVRSFVVFCATGGALASGSHGLRRPGWRGIEKTFAHLLLETRGASLPHDARMFQHVHAVGMRQRERDVLLAEQHGDGRGLLQLVERLR